MKKQQNTRNRAESIKNPHIPHDSEHFRQIQHILSCKKTNNIRPTDKGAVLTTLLPFSYILT